jgi:hypothetical protein
MNKFLNTIILAAAIFLTGNWLWATNYGSVGLGVTNIWTADQIYNDNVKLTLGTGGDADIYYDGAHLMVEPMVAGSGNLVINDETQLWIGPQGAASSQDHGSATTAIIVNQEAADDAILAFKSSEVVTGITSIPLRLVSETDDFALFGKASGDTGGVTLAILKESTSGNIFHLDTYGGPPNTASTTAAFGAITFSVGEHAGSNDRVDMAADSNAFAIREITSAGASLTRLALKADDGVLYLGNATPVGFANHDDAALIADFENFRTQGQLISDYATMRASGEYDRLVAVDLIGKVTEQEWNDGVRPLMNIQRSLQLQRGNSKQQLGRLDALLDILENDPGFRANYNARLVARGLGHLGRP